MNDSAPILAPYFIEILDRHDEVKARHRFEQLPITIGRAYANDLILDDANVAHFHAVVALTDNATLSIRELGSQQGLIHKGKRVAALTVDGRDGVKLGNTTIRIRSAGYVADSQPTSTSSAKLDGVLPAILGLFMLTLSCLLHVWLASADKFSMVGFLFMWVMVILMVLLWSGCWAFANRVISGQSRFGRHLFIVSCATVLIDFWTLISTLIAYAFSWDFISAYGNHSLVAIFAGMVFYQLTTVSEQSRKRFIVISVVLAIFGSGLVLLINYQRSGGFADELYMSRLLPPEIRQSQNQTTDAFMQGVKQLQPKVDKARSEKFDGSNDFVN